MSRVLVDSGIKWIGFLPNTWSITTVNKLFYRKKEVNDSKDPTILSLARDGVKIRDISTNEGQLAESYDNYHKVYKGDLLINPMDLISGANCSLSEVEGVISPAYINLAKKTNIYPKYYDYFFKYQYWIKAMFIHGKGVSFDNRWTINWETMASYKVPYPKYNEQKRIADYLNKKCSKIDEIIKDNNKEIELLEEYKRSLINENIYFHYSDVIKLKYVVNVRNEKGKSVNSMDFISLENIESGTGKYIATETDYTNCDGNIFKKGDLLINKLRPYLAKSYLAEFDGVCTSEMVVVSHFEGNMDYLKYFTLSPKYIDVVNSSTYGTKMPRASWDFIKNLKMPYISLNEQNRIVSLISSKLCKLDQVIDYRKQIIEKLEEYKKSLIYECVTGKKEV